MRDGQSERGIGWERGKGGIREGKLRTGEEGRGEREKLD